MAVVVGLVSPAPVADAAPAAPAQQPTPERPLLLVAGTFMPGNSANEAETHDDLLRAMTWFEQEGGYQRNQDLFVIDLARQDTRPPNWPDEVPEEWPALLPTPEDGAEAWDDLVSLLNGFGVSTAGLAPIEASVARITYSVMSILNLPGVSEIDIIAHSQGAPVVRRVIRNMGQANAVHTMISLGGGNFGIPPEGFYVPGLDDFMLGCRNGDWIPVCPDMIYDPGPDDVHPAATASPFIGDLNRAADPGNPDDLGPVPPPTTYYHFYSELFGDPAPGVVPRGAETLLLFPGEPHVTNRSMQAVCLWETMGEVERPLHHNYEWIDPAMQELMVQALGIRPANPAACYAPLVGP